MATYEELLTQEIVGTKETKLGSAPDPLSGGFGGDPLRGGRGASQYLNSFKPENPEYNTKEVFKAGFEQENATYNLVNAAFTQHVGEWEEDYNPFDEIEGTKYEIYQDHFLSAYNQLDAQRIKDKIDKEEENRKILASSGALGVAAGMTAAVFDLPNLIPVGGVSYKLYKGGRIAQAAATGAIGGAVSAGVAEGVLQSTQELRTDEESVYNIAGATVLGGILGGAAGGISKIRFNKLAKNLEKELQPQPAKIEKVDIENKTVDLKENIEGKVDEFGFIKREGDAGAAFDFEANFKERFQEYGFGGNKAAQTAFQATKKLNPMLRIFDDPIAQSKETMLKLVRTNLQTKGVAEGLEKPTSVENSLTRLQRNLATALEQNKKAFIATSTNKVGARFGKGFKQFNEEVSKAIRQGKHENPEIQKAADTFRQEVFQKIGKEANDVGLFAKDIDVTKNPNYFPRFPDVPKIVAKQDDFKKLIFDKAKERLIPSIKREFSTKQENLITQINDLNARQAEIEDLFKKAGDKKFDEIRENLGLKNSNEELVEIYDNFKAAKRVIRTLRPKSLFQFIKENGGIYDSGGELSSRDFAKKTVGLIRKDRFQPKVTKSGSDFKRTDVDVSMDAVTQRAWEAGYFPEFQERPTINDLLEKIDQQLAGNKVYSEYDLDEIETIERANDFLEEMSSLGIDPEKIKEAILTGKTGGFEKTKETKTKTDLITTETKIKEQTKQFSKSLLNNEKEKLRAKKLRLDKKYKKIQSEYEELFGKPEDVSDIVRFNDGTSKTRAQILEDDYAKEIAKSIFDKYRGLENQLTLPYDLKIGARGPAKSRTLTFVNDNEIAPFVEQDITKVAARYIRTMGADIEIKKRFGDLNLKDDFDKINKEYDLLESKATTEKERLKLNKQRKETVKILEMFRDMIRGNYKSTRDIDGFFAQAAQVSRSIQYLSKMGDVTRSSFADIAQPIYKHGLGRVLKGSIQKLITDRKAAAKITETNKLGGQAAEHILNTRAASLYDINNPYSEKSSFMNFLDTTTANFSNLNLMNFWNNTAKDFSGFFTHQRMIKNIKNFSKIKPAEKEYLANLGIGAGNIDDIAQQLSKYGTKEGSVQLPNLEKWDNIEAKNLYLDAANLDIDSTIITKGVGDVPMWMNTEWGKTLGQFRSFAFAANQQVFLAGLQRSDAAAVNGMISLITGGMMVYYMKTVSAGKELSDDPMVWLIEGIDRSGINPILMEANGLLEPFGLGVGGERKLSRYASRNFAGSLAGPTFGALQDVGQVGYGMISGDLSESDQKAARRNIPYQNLIWLRLLEGQLKEK